MSADINEKTRGGMIDETEKTICLPHRGTTVRQRVHGYCEACGQEWHEAEVVCHPSFGSSGE